MKKHIFQGLLLLFSFFVGSSVFYYFYYVSKGWAWVVLGGLLGLALGLVIIYLEEMIRKLSVLKIIGGSIGLILGLMLAKLISSFFEVFTSGVWEVFLYLMSALGLGYLGIMLGGKKIEEIKLSEYLDKFSEKIISKFSSSVKSISKKTAKRGTPKIIDTSAIIDGRLVEIVKTGWLEGPFLIPRIVLEEVHLLSDSTDPQKRAKGKRALELLNELKEICKGELKIVEDDYINLSTDEKLIKIAHVYGGKLITTDYNLNKVSKLYGVDVLNVNELFLALRPTIRPGDMLSLQIVKEGKEKEQGVGYLEDGTMVVVENGKALIGKEVEVVVSHLIHSPSGRIIFTQLKNPKVLYSS
ncbi:MAG: PIN/TRAM domain-containing protein [Caldimicrobium sp.]